MAVFKHFPRNLLINLKTDGFSQISYKHITSLRLLSYSPREYGEDPNPAPVFIKTEVQSLLKTLTRIDLSKVYKKRKLGDKRLEQPVVKFMTDNQLQETFDNIKKKVDEIIQMPPVLPVHKPINRILSKDPVLQGLDTANFVFTDITFGIPNLKRLIVIRDTDGNLKEADWEVRSRMNQIYFPIKGRSIRVPKMFQDHYFEDVLKRVEYEFILDRACAQFEPNDADYQKIVSITYQHCNDNNGFEALRSTRHFGCLSFFLAWHKMIDNLLLDLIETSNIEEAGALVRLYGIIHKQQFDKDNLKSVEEYIKKFSDKRGALELTLQAYRDLVKRNQELEAGIKAAHGHT